MGGVRPARRASSRSCCPGRSRIAEALWTFRGDAVRHAIPTIIETVLGFRLAVVLAIVAAAAMDRVRVVRRAVEPILVTSQTIPVVALAPLFLLWFGFGLAPKVLIVVLVTFFPIVVALLDGFRSDVPGRRGPAALVRGDRRAGVPASSAGRRRCRRSSSASGSPSCTR